jgi:hypothetical protein
MAGKRSDLGHVADQHDQVVLLRALQGGEGFGGGSFLARQGGVHLDRTAEGRVRSG